MFISYIAECCDLRDIKDYLTKPELFVLDFLAGYQWDRPFNVLSYGGDLNIGIKDYLMYDGFSYRFTPIRNKPSSTDAGKVDALALYDRMTSVYKWDALKRTDWFVDYQNLYTFMGVLSQRQLFLTVANALIDIREDEKALEIMDLCQENYPEANFPLESLPLGFAANDYMVAQMIENYYYLGDSASAADLASRMGDQLMDTIAFYVNWGSLGSSEFETAGRILMYIADVCDEYGDKELAASMTGRLSALLHALGGNDDAEELEDELDL